MLNLHEQTHRIKQMMRLLNEEKIEIPKIPNTMNFWHGGNLDDYYDTIAHKKGRHEYGAGLYLTTHYETAKKYSKGGRKLYLITVEIGNDINDSLIDLKNVINFIDTYIKKNKRKEIKDRLEKYTKDSFVKAYIFNNIILNENAIDSSKTNELRQFYIDNNIDYDIIDNPYGWGEKMMVLYNMRKIVNKIQIKPTDKIDNYNLKL